MFPLDSFADLVDKKASDKCGHGGHEKESACDDAQAGKD
jgi:hypothetical protein